MQNTEINLMRIQDLNIIKYYMHTIYVHICKINYIQISNTYTQIHNWEVEKYPQSMTSKKDTQERY